MAEARGALALNTMMGFPLGNALFLFPYCPTPDPIHPQVWEAKWRNGRRYQEEVGEALPVAPRPSR